MEGNQVKFKVRDKRNKGWFFVDNEYLNGYGKVLGGLGIAIYVDLCRHADSDQKCFPSQKLIAKELKMGERTVRKYIKLFERYHIIEITKERSNKGKWLNNTYWLLDKTEWIKPKATITSGLTKGNRMPTQRHLTTQPEADDNSLRIPIKKNTNKKNTNFSSSKLKPFYKITNQPMWKDSYGKWFVIRGKDDFSEFAGDIKKDIVWK